MRIRIEEGLEIGWTINSFRPKERSACFVLKSTFRLEHGNVAALAEEQEPLGGDLHVDDDAAKSLLYPSDFVPYKPRADVLVLATAHAPGKQPLTRLSVRIRVGALDKSLTVLGPRVWERGTWGGSTPGAPKPFASAPITYENALGGPKSPKNPVGRGFGTDAPPLVEDPRRPVTGTNDAGDPAGFAPVAVGWQPRAGLAGKYDQRWQKERWPWFPEDFDYGYFNAAPSDQQVEGYLRGDEELVFDNLHPEHVVFRTRLPGRRVRCFLEERDARGQNAFREVALNLDTLWIDLNAGKMALTWRGHVPVRTIKLREVQQVLAWWEPLADPRRPASHCAAFVAEHERAEDAPFAMPEAEAQADAEASAESERATAEFDKAIAASELELAEFEAAADKEAAAHEAALIASGLDPAVLQPKPQPEGAAEALLAAIAALRPGNPEKAAELEADLVEIQALDAESAELNREFDADSPPELTRDDVIARAAHRESLAGRDLDALDLSGVNLSGLDLTHVSLHAAILRDANLHRANLTGADLGQADLSGADLSNAILDGADLSGAKLGGAKLANLSVNGTDLSGLVLVGADLLGAAGEGANFSRADLTGANLAGARLPKADFAEAKLERADFRVAELFRADLDGVKAAGAVFEGADLVSASANGADLTGANFMSAKAPQAVFDGAMLDRANFSRSKLSRAQFSEASARDAVFDRADLSAAAFDGAALAGATLTNANLIRANFDQADMSGADLRGSNLYEAGFWETMLDKADFRKANLKGTTLV